MGCIPRSTEHISSFFVLHGMPAGTSDEKGQPECCPNYPCKKLLVWEVPFMWKFGGYLQITDFRSVFARSASVVTPSKTSSINTNGKSTMCFPVITRWSSYVASKSAKHCEVPWEIYMQKKWNFSDNMKWPLRPSKMCHFDYCSQAEVWLAATWTQLGFYKQLFNLDWSQLTCLPRATVDIQYQLVKGMFYISLWHRLF